MPQHLVEQDVFHFTHAEVGAYLLGTWGLPFAIVEAVAYHHRPGALVGGVNEALAAVHLADALASSPTNEPLDGPDGRLDLDFLASAGLGREFSAWRSLAEELIPA